MSFISFTTIRTDIGSLGLYG